jgi:hypothetical protein
MKKISIISILAVGAIGVGVYFIYKKNKANAAAKKAAAAATAAATGTGTSNGTGTGTGTTTPNTAGVENTTAGNTNIAPSNAIDLTTAEKSTILKKGSTGTLVKILQTFLNFQEPENPLTVDGNFGELTEKKLIIYDNYISRSLGALKITKYNPSNFIGYTIFNTRAV